MLQIYLKFSKVLNLLSFMSKFFSVFRYSSVIMFTLKCFVKINHDDCFWENAHLLLIELTVCS